MVLKTKDVKYVLRDIIQMEVLHAKQHLLEAMLVQKAVEIIHHVLLEHIKMKRDKQVVYHVLLEHIKMKQERQVVKAVLWDTIKIQQVKQVAKVAEQDTTVQVQECRQELHVLQEHIHQQQMLHHLQHV